MGTVVAMDRARPATRRTPRPVEIFFDLSDPDTYLTAERLDGRFSRVRWTPASHASLARRPRPDERARAERRAAALDLPLQWPARHPAEVPRAMRVVTYAAERRAAADFVLAAGRLAFCGGFDLEDPEVLAEAAAAAGLSLDGTLAAARDVARDAAIDGAARRLLAAGADSLPVMRNGRDLVCGEERIVALVARTAPA